MTRIIVLLALIAVAAPQAKSQLVITGVLNSASFESSLPAGGGLATIFCSGTDPSGNLKPGTYLAATSSPLPYQLGGLGVGIDDAAAPILAVVITSAGQSLNAQINFQVPLERNVSLPSLPSSYPGSLSACGATPIPLPPQSEWGGFFADATGHAIAQHASDYGIVTVQNPAHAGETIIVYANDFFPVWPPPTRRVSRPTTTAISDSPGA